MNTVFTPTLFMDIDGVLAPYGSDGSLDRACVAHLNSIVEATGAVVVISSTWRVSFTLEELREQFVDAGFSGEIVGMTPVLLGQSRGAEVQSYLDAHPEAGPVAIIDDSDDLEHLSHRLILTDEFEGLTSTFARAAIAALQGR